MERVAAGAGNRVVGPSPEISVTARPFKSNSDAPVALIGPSETSLILCFSDTIHFNFEGGLLMQCPIDEHSMTVHSAGQLRAESCPYCHGLWISHSQFVAFKSLPRILADGDLTRTLVGINQGFNPQVRFGSTHYKCPGCERTLESRDADGALIDVCTVCGGAWLDAGELDHVLPIYLQSGASDPQSDIVGSDAPVLDAAYVERLRSEAARGNTDLWPALLNKTFRGRRPGLKLRFKGDRLQILLDVDDVPGEGVGAALIFTAFEDLNLSGVRQYKVYAVRNGPKALSEGWAHEFEQSGSEKRGRFDRFSFNDPVGHALALPVAALLAVIINAGPVSGFLAPFHVWIHEFGHATVAWLGGRRALPLPFGWTSWQPDRSAVVYFALLFLLAVLFSTGWRERLRWPMAMAGGIALVQFFMTWRLSAPSIEFWVTFGGVGGEFYLSTLLMISFYFRMPDRWRWDFWRYVVLVIAASTFWQNFWLWHRVRTGQAQIPWGSILGAGDADGDMDRLSWQFGWSDGRIIDSYSRLGEACLLVLIVAYLVFLVKLNPQSWTGLKYRMALWRAEKTNSN